MAGGSRDHLSANLAGGHWSVFDDSGADGGGWLGGFALEDEGLRMFGREYKASVDWGSELCVFRPCQSFPRLEIIVFQLIDIQVTILLFSLRLLSLPSLEHGLAETAKLRILVHCWNSREAS